MPVARAGRHGPLHGAGPTPRAGDAQESGPHGLSEALYAFTSACEQQRLRVRRARARHPVLEHRSSDWRCSLGRFAPMVLVLALAGRFAAQRTAAGRPPAPCPPTARCSSVLLVGRDGGRRRPDLRPRARPRSRSRKALCMSTATDHAAPRPGRPRPRPPRGRRPARPPPGGPRSARCASSTRARWSRTPGHARRRGRRGHSPRVLADPRPVRLRLERRGVALAHRALRATWPRPSPRAAARPQAGDAAASTRTGSTRASCATPAAGDLGDEVPGHRPAPGDVVVVDAGQTHPRRRGRRRGRGQGRRVGDHRRVRAGDPRVRRRPERRHRRHRWCSRTGSWCRITAEAGRDLRRPDDRPGRGRRAGSKHAQRDRAERPARLASTIVFAGRGGRACSRSPTTPAREQSAASCSSRCSCA